VVSVSLFPIFFLCVLAKATADSFIASSFTRYLLRTLRRIQHSYLDLRGRCDSYRRSACFILGVQILPQLAGSNNTARLQPPGATHSIIGQHPLRNRLRCLSSLFQPAFLLGTRCSEIRNVVIRRCQARTESMGILILNCGHPFEIGPRIDLSISIKDAVRNSNSACARNRHHCHEKGFAFLSTPIRPECLRVPDRSRVEDKSVPISLWNCIKDTLNCRNGGLQLLIRVNY
jgi:hypothetical protein